ncbi:hypothetical protein NIES4075_55780 [Tolypothrix sp. NIES-4075]|nr:hypothetical protein NIES4075_55780 [Tolypothrix sp. NIES-4075]
MYLTSKRGKGKRGGSAVRPAPVLVSPLAPLKVSSETAKWRTRSRSVFLWEKGGKRAIDGGLALELGLGVSTHWSICRERTGSALQRQCRAKVTNVEASGVGVPPVVAPAYDWRRRDFHLYRCTQFFQG